MRNLLIHRTIAELHMSYPEYLWYPGALANATHSAENLAGELRRRLDSQDGSLAPGELKAFIRDTLIRDGLGVRDITDAEIQHIANHPDVSAYDFADIISRRAQIGWSTHGHSAVDVNIYSSSKDPAIAGNRENTEVGNFIQHYLEVDLAPITKELVDKGIQLDAAAVDGVQGSWMGRAPTHEGLDVLDHYHGDYKH